MSNFFTPKKQVLKTPQQAYSELLGNSEENQIVSIDINLIDEIDNQPQKVHEDKIERIAESMKIVGQLDPAIVIPSANNDGRYILLAGRHRKRACQKIGKDKLLCVIKKETDRDKQRLMLLATNNDRNTDYLPSELAYSYKEQQDLLIKLGSKATASKIASENNTNRKTVHKYIQLTKLIPDLMSCVDNNTLTVGAGYELSFMPADEQRKFYQEQLNQKSKVHITKETARNIRNINSETQTDSSAPKAEKKTVKYSLDTELPLQMQYELGKFVFKNLYSLMRFILADVATQEEVKNFISNRYINSYQSTVKGDNIKLKFEKTKIDFEYTGEYESVKHKLKYDEFDSLLRRYIRKHIPMEEKIQMLKE